jgi:selenoprotein W-related protein
LAATIKKNMGIDATLTKGSNGIFDVKLDGKMIFSKYAEDRFPDEPEVLEAMRELL